MKRHEQGSATALFLVGSWTLILVGLIIAADFGRLLFYREQMVTATEAAALAGASQVVRWVEVTAEFTVPGEVRCLADDGKTNLDPCIQDPPVTYTNTQAWPYPQPANWEAVVCMGYGCVTKVWRCWLVPKQDTFDDSLELARQVFWANAEGTQWADWAHVELERPPNIAARNDWGWFWVRVKADARVPTVLWGALNKPGMQVSRLGTDGRPSRIIESLAKPLLRRGNFADRTDPPLVCPGVQFH